MVTLIARDAAIRDQIRPAPVASVLRRRGLDATLVVGGMVDWTKRGYPTEKGAVSARASS